MNAKQTIAIIIPIAIFIIKKIYQSLYNYSSFNSGMYHNILFIHKI